jgi:alcohol dehydrogenase, propanol-preferring
MKAWQFYGTNEPLQLVERAIPTIAPHEVLIEIKAAGLCHSDVGVLNDPKWIPSIKYLPITIGHEIAGKIVEVGDEVVGFQEGDRVGVCPVSKLGKTPGYGYDGGYAEFVAVPAVDLVPIPPTVSYELAAIGTDAGMSSYHALFERGGAKKGMKVGIIGIGGLGQNAARMAVIEGCEVYAVDTNPKARALAESLEVEAVYDSVDELKQHQCDIIVDYAGYGSTTVAAIESVRKRGTVVVVGMGKLEATIDTNTLILKEVNILGSNGGTAEDIAQVYKYYASGKLSPIIHKITLEEIPEGLRKLEKHEVEGRIVALME